MFYFFYYTRCVPVRAIYRFWGTRLRGYRFWGTWLRSYRFWGTRLRGYRFMGPILRYRVLGYKVDTHNDLYIIGRGYPVDSIITIVVETPYTTYMVISISNGGAAATHLLLVLGSRYNLRMNYSQTKAKAKRRGIPFLLDSQDFAFLVSKPCHYCGARESIGLDRINTKGPYSKENVVPACTFCNTLRGAIPWELWNDFLRGVNGWYVPDPDLLKPVEDRPFKSMWRGR